MSVALDGGLTPGRIRVRVDETVTLPYFKATPDKRNVHAVCRADGVTVVLGVEILGGEVMVAMIFEVYAVFSHSGFCSVCDDPSK